MVVFSTLLAILVIGALIAGLGWFVNKTQAQSQQRYDANNLAGTLRTEPYRRPDRRSRKFGTERDVD